MYALFGSDRTSTWRLSFTSICWRHCSGRQESIFVLPAKANSQFVAAHLFSGTESWNHTLIARIVARLGPSAASSSRHTPPVRSTRVRGTIPYVQVRSNGVQHGRVIMEFGQYVSDSSSSVLCRSKGVADSPTTHWLL